MDLGRAGRGVGHPTSWRPAWNVYERVPLRGSRPSSCSPWHYPPRRRSPSPLGEWITEGGKARVRLAPCSSDAQRLCGVITWSYRPPGAESGPLRDIHNQDPALRSRPIVGLSLLQNSFRPGLTTGAVGRSTTPRAARLTNPRCASKRPTDWRLAVASCSSAGARPGPAKPRGSQTHEARLQATHDRNRPLHYGTLQQPRAAHGREAALRRASPRPAWVRSIQGEGRGGGGRGRDGGGGEEGGGRRV